MSWPERCPVSPGRTADAIRAAEEGARLGPNEVWSWVLLSGVRRVAGQFAEAVSAAKRALSIEPNSVLARVLLGVTQATRGDLERASARGSGSGDRTRSGSDTINRKRKGPGSEYCSP